MKNCTSPDDKSCFSQAYKVVNWGDVYYNLGCSSQAAKAEVKMDKVGVLRKVLFIINLLIILF